MAELQWRSSLHDPFIHHILQAFDAEIRAGCPGGRLPGDSLGMALGLHLLNRYGTVGAGVSSGAARPVSWPASRLPLPVLSGGRGLAGERNIRL